MSSAVAPRSTEAAERGGRDVARRPLAAWRWWLRMAAAGVRLLPAAARSRTVRRDLAFLWRTTRGRRRAFPRSLLPVRAYVRWRLETAYGDGDAVPPAGELLRVAHWARREDEAARLPPPPGTKALSGDPIAAAQAAAPNAAPNSAPTAAPAAAPNSAPPSPPGHEHGREHGRANGLERSAPRAPRS